MASDLPPAAVNGEFVFQLTERTDKNGAKYLFAGIQIFNVVVFLFPQIVAPGDAKRWKCVVRPYMGPKVDNGVWNEEKEG